MRACARSRGWSAVEGLSSMDLLRCICCGELSAPLTLAPENEPPYCWRCWPGEEGPVCECRLGGEGAG